MQGLKLAGSVRFPAVLVLTSQMSVRDLINHALGVLLILSGALERRAGDKAIL